MDAAATKIKIFNTARKIRLPQKGCHFIVGAGSVKCAEVGLGFAFDGDWC
jgi:hypothetical protein